MNRYTSGIATISIVLWATTVWGRGAAEEAILEMLAGPPAYHTVSARQFERLGWELPDDGRAVKALADDAPGGAFDPHLLEALPSAQTGYTSRWHELRYEHYGLEWDITGLQLIPEQPVKGAPTLVLIHGGSSNWYEFFVDPFNEPGLGQYLAQKVPVVLVTIPGNYRPGGWTEARLDARVPGYLLDREIRGEELAVRNAVYTFQLVADGVEKLLQAVTTGPIVIVGHSTAGELPFMLQHSSLRDRMQGRVLGWGSGGTSAQRAMQDRWGYDSRPSGYPPVEKLRPRPVSGYAGDYLGPLNPAWDERKSREEIAGIWMGQQEFRRRPHFKQPLQDMERRGAIPEIRESVIAQVKEVLEGNRFGIDPQEVVGELFAPLRVPLSDYRKMIWTTSQLDTGHWNMDNPSDASTVQVADEFRELLPGVPVRVLLFDVPMTHYGHIERPQQLAGGLYAALQWLMR